MTINLELPLWGIVVLAIGFVSKLVHDHYMQKQIEKDLCDFKEKHKEDIGSIRLAAEKDVKIVKDSLHTEHQQIRESHQSFKQFIYGELKLIREDQLNEQKELRKILEELVKSNSELNVAVQYMGKEIESIKKAI